MVCQAGKRAPFESKLHASDEKCLASEGLGQMTKELVLQLRYAGVFPQTGLREYRFEISKENRADTRQVVLTIEDALFSTRLLLFQEAPDLCYQKLLQSMRDSETTPIGARTKVTASDVAYYRDNHPNTRMRKHRSTGSV
jgi:hypothetical protein